MWVIEGLISENDILDLAELNLLNPLAQCSRSVVLDSVEMYLDHGPNEHIRDLLRTAYRGRLQFRNAQTDERLLSLVTTVNGYNYESVNDVLSVKELIEMRDNILGVHNSAYDIPYTNPIPGDVINSIIDSLLAASKCNHNVRYKTLATYLAKNKMLFRDKDNAVARGTIFKSISKRSRELDILVRGIDFLLAMKEAGIPSEAWRVF